MYTLCVVLLSGISLRSAISNRVVASERVLPINFGPSAFLSVHNLFLGVTADSTIKKNFSVTRAGVACDEDGNISLNFYAYAQPYVALNLPLPKSQNNNNNLDNAEDVDINDLSKKCFNLASPVYNQAITSITTCPEGPIVVLGSDVVAPILGAKQKIALIDAGGDHVSTNIVKINDAQGLSTSGIESIVCVEVQKAIFAAVAPNGGIFGQPGTGIAAVHKNESGPLTPVNLVTGDIHGNRAVPILNTVASGQLAIEQDVTIGSIVDMYWDSCSARLYVALSVKRADDTQAGGAIALLVGHISSPFQLTLTPVIGLNASNFTPNATDSIFGFYFDNTDTSPVAATIYNVRTLHSSTGLNYLIVNGGVSTGDTHNQIYALPLVQRVRNGDSVDNDSYGRVSNKNDFTQVASGVTTMTHATDAAALVGQGPLPATSDQKIFVLQAVKDAVIVGLAGDPMSGVRDATHETGFFQSTALFDATGRIMSWTPWQRVMGSTDRVLGGGLDGSTAQFIYLTNNNPVDPYGPLPDASTVKATVWGKGARDGLLGGTKTNEEVGLVALMAERFIQERAGISQIFDFDVTTQTFSAPNANGSLAMMVATGLRQIALIETGRFVDGVFTPTTGDFKNHTIASVSGFAPMPAPDTRVMIITGGALNQLGPIMTSDVSRTPRADGTANGWLFVGGYHGVAVLSKPDGSGWDTSTAGGLKSGFTGITDAMSFKKLDSFERVRRVLCDDEFVYILTMRELVRMPLDAANFSDAGALDPQITVLASAEDLTGSACSAFNDFVISSKMAVIGSTHGIFFVGEGGNIQSATSASDINWMSILINDCPMGNVIQLSTISETAAGFAQGGNLYALVANLSINLAAVYRFVVHDTTTQPVGTSTVRLIGESTSRAFYLSFDVLRENIIADGALLFNEMPKNFGRTNFLSIIPMSSNPDKNNIRDYSVSLDVDVTTANIGEIRRDSASGAWIVPGDFGIRVNE